MSLPGAGWEDVDGRDKRGHDLWVSLSAGWYDSLRPSRVMVRAACRDEGRGRTIHDCAACSKDAARSRAAARSRDAARSRGAARSKDVDADLRRHDGMAPAAVRQSLCRLVLCL